MTEQRQAFAPDWVSPPGETIADLLDERHWTQAELAERAGFTPEYVHDLLEGRAAITAETAGRLDLVFGGTSRFWLTREAQYRAALQGAAPREPADRADDGTLPTCGDS